MNAVRFIALVLTGLLLIASGCGKPPAPPQPVGHPLPSPAVAQCEPGRRGGRLTLVIAGAPRTFNPLFAADGASDEAVRMIFGSLINLDLTTLDAQPALAESWSVAADSKTWTFKLRAGLRWSDGQPLTADDVVFTWNEVMYNPDMNRNTYDLFRIGGKNFSVSKVDDLTVRVVTPEVFAPFVEYFGGVAILPRHIMGLAVQTRNFLSVYPAGARPQQIVGCGPFRVKQNQPGRLVLLERNPEFWMVDKQGQRLPYFDEVMLTVGEAGQTETMFLNGKCDVLERTRPDQYAQFKSAAASVKFRLLELGVGTERDFLWFNLNPGTNSAGQPLVNPAKLKWFQNEKFRQGVACALDRERMVHEIYGGRAEPMYGFISKENQKWNDPNIPRYAYDPPRARVLLAGAGLQDRNGDGVLEDTEGRAVEFTLYSNTGNASRAKCAKFIAEDLGKVGIKAKSELVDFRALVEKVNSTFDYECVLMGLGGGGVDPASQLNVLKSSEFLHQWYPNQKKPATDWEARMDTLLDAQMRTLDFATRKKYFDEVQVILAEELPMIYTVAAYNFAATRPDLANVRPSVLTPYRVTWNVQELYFKQPAPAN
jgi:peptide/nickel transport system substrate-binding protein